MLDTGTNYIGLASVNIGGSLPALAAGANFIGLATVVMASAPTLFAVVNTSAAGQASVVLDVGTKYVGLVTTTLHRGPILGAGDTNALFASTATGSSLNVALMDRTGNVAKVETTGALDVLNVAGSSYIGLASVNIGGTLPALTAGAAYIGLASVNIGGSLPALTAGANFIGLATVVFSRGPILGAGDTNALFASTATGSSFNVALMDRNGHVANIETTGALDVLNLAGANYIGLASVNIGGTLPALAAGANYIGLASVNIGGTLPALAAGANYVGLASVNIGGSLPPLATGTNFVGLATVVPSYGSNVTVYTKIISATGNTTVFVAPASNRFWLKSIHVSSMGKSEVEIRSGATTIIPFTSLATQGGYAHDWSEFGYPSRAQADGFVVGLNGAATISVACSVYFAP